MKSYSLTHLADDTLLGGLKALVTQDCGTTAQLLAHLAEVEDRRLYRQAAYPSMSEYCVRELHMSEETAYRRIRAARAARKCPAIFSAVSDGRLHLTAVVLLAPELTRENADELIAAATHKTRAEIELLLAQRFPQPDVPTLVQTISTPVAANQQSSRQAVPSAAPNASIQTEPLALAPVVPSDSSNTTQSMVPPVARSEPRGRIAPLSPGRFAIQFTGTQATHDLLREARELLSHAVPSGEISEIVERAVREMVERLKRRKFATTSRPRTVQTSGWVPSDTPANRYVPAEIRREVSKRDGGRCTFVSSAGKRCESRTRLEYDHVEAVARGGATTIGNLRLRCKAHNQFAAECDFGADFMRGKREAAREKAARGKAWAGGDAPSAVGTP